jgi:hypothetical protein
MLHSYYSDSTETAHSSASSSRSVAADSMVRERLRGRQAAARALAVSPVDQLAREIRQLELASRPQGAERKTIGTGCQALDACLPHGGYQLGSVVEYLRSGPACGASYLALAAAASAMRATDGFMVVVDTRHTIYPPALSSQEIDLNKVIFVRPQSHVDAMWAVDQALRNSAVAVVVADLPQVDDRSARRLQLAAESGASLAILMRGATACQQPSWAEVQWLVGSEEHPISFRTPFRIGANRTLQVQLVRARGGHVGMITRVEIDAVSGQLSQGVPAVLERGSSQHERQEQPSNQRRGPTEGAVHLATQLAHATNRSRRAAAG